MSVLTFYHHDAAAVPLSGTLPSTNLSLTTPDATATGASTARLMDSTIGIAQTSIVIADPASIPPSNMWMRMFCSTPLQAQTIAAQTVTMRAGVQMSNTDAHLQFFFNLCFWRPSTGAVVSRLVDSSNSGGIGAVTTEQDFSWAVTSTAQTCIAGDILVHSFWLRAVHTIATSYNDTLYYDGTTVGSTSTNAANLTFTTAVLLLDLPHVNPMYQLMGR